MHAQIHDAFCCDNAQFTKNNQVLIRLLHLFFSHDFSYLKRSDETSKRVKLICLLHTGTRLKVSGKIKFPFCREVEIDVGGYMTNEYNNFKVGNIAPRFYIVFNVFFNNHIYNINFSGFFTFQYYLLSK